MGTFKFNYRMSSVGGRHRHLMLSLSESQLFNADGLGLGELSKAGETLEALAAIFDLEGFTSFCGQVDSQLVVPNYLEQWLRWLFSEISATFAKEYTNEGVVLWGKLPFFAKFTGDGVLFLWDTKGLGPASLGNIIINLYRVSRGYHEEFTQRIRASFDNPPANLRCGIARGEVIPLGGGKDFIGTCINVASRLQKVSQLSFAFSRRGLDPVQCFSRTWQERFALKRIAIRGVGEDQLVHILKDEFDALPEIEKAFFGEP